MDNKSETEFIKFVLTQQLLKSLHLFMEMKENGYNYTTG